MSTDLTFFLLSKRLFNTATVSPSGRGVTCFSGKFLFKVVLIDGVNGVGGAGMLPEPARSSGSSSSSASILGVDGAGAGSTEDTPADGEAAGSCEGLAPVSVSGASDGGFGSFRGEMLYGCAGECSERNQRRTPL